MNKRIWNTFMQVAVLGMTLLFLSSCEDRDLQVTVDSIDIQAESITKDSAVVVGEVVTNTPTVIYNSGVCWGKVPGPDIYENDYYRAGEGDGSFTAMLKNLEPETVYYVRGFANNNISTVYGEEISFTTGSPIIVPPCIPRTNAVRFNGIERVFTGRVEVANFFGDWGIHGRSWETELRFTFSGPPRSGKYTLLAPNSPLDGMRCSVMIILHGFSTTYFSGKSGSTLYVQKSGSDQYNMTFCDIEFTSQTTSHTETTSGNLTLN